jgi:tRNA G46 methylase TrmB
MRKKHVHVRLFYERKFQDFDLLLVENGLLVRVLDWKVLVDALVEIEKVENSRNAAHPELEVLLLYLNHAGGAQIIYIWRNPASQLDFP